MDGTTVLQWMILAKFGLLVWIITAKVQQHLQRRQIETQKKRMRSDPALANNLFQLKLANKEHLGAKFCYHIRSLCLQLCM